jgi:hypothetical protein
VLELAKEHLHMVPFVGEPVDGQVQRVDDEQLDR